MNIAIAVVALAVDIGTDATLITKNKGRTRKRLTNFLQALIWAFPDGAAAVVWVRDMICRPKTRRLRNRNADFAPSGRPR
jgi:hypothetical protein